MKALVKKEARPGLWMEEVPRPAIGASDVLIRVRKAAICGTDVHIYNWDAWAAKTIPVPMVVGHEFMGIVEEVGEDVVDYRPGDRVTAEGHITCGHCRNCRAGRRHLCRKTKGVGVNRPGCFADFVSIPSSNVFKLPATIPDDVASIFDPYGNATHTALSFDLIGEDVLITGAGPIGCMAAAIARHVGARFVVVTDMNDYRLDLANKLGATRVLNPAQGTLTDVMKDLGMTEGFDVGLEMSGAPRAFQSMLEVMNHGGRLALLGIFAEPVAIDWSQVIFKGLHLKGIYGREMFETWYKMSTMLESGLDIAGVITHRFPADEFERGFEIVRAGKSGKVILDWQ
jgi:threonine 3-dehydrogenase